MTIQRLNGRFPKLIMLKGVNSARTSRVLLNHKRSHDAMWFYRNLGALMEVLGEGGGPQGGA